MLINDLTLLLDLFGNSEETKLLIWTVISCLVFTAPEKWRVELRAKTGHYRNRYFGICNAKSMFCQNIVPLGQLEAEILIDLCDIKRSYFPDPIKRSYVTEWSVLCTYTTTIFIWVYYTKKYISKHLASVHHNSSTLKGLFLRFYGSDPGDTTFWNSTNSFESEPLKICFLTLLKSCTFWVTTFLYVGDDMYM